MKSLSAHVKTAYKLTPQYDLDRLLAERSRWQRKSTIAGNKLASVQRKLDKLAQTHVNTLMGKEQNES